LSGQIFRVLALSQEASRNDGDTRRMPAEIKAWLKETDQMDRSRFRQWTPDISPVALEYIMPIKTVKIMVRPYL
jgi:hypothetical protein